MKKQPKPPFKKGQIVRVKPDSATALLFALDSEFDDIISDKDCFLAIVMDVFYQKHEEIKEYHWRLQLKFLNPAVNAAFGKKFSTWMACNCSRVYSKKYSDLGDSVDLLNI